MGTVTIDKPRAKKQSAKTPLQRLTTRITREIQRKKFIGDIIINDDEYKLLIDHLRFKIKYVMVGNYHVKPDVCLAVGLVQIGIKRYKDGVFWPYAAEEIGTKLINKPGKYRSYLSDVFYATITHYKLANLGQSETVHNILLHGYISDYYSEQYFDFLYAFYRLDLGRNISLLNRETINTLFESISSESSARKYMLREQVQDAIAANTRGCKIRIRRHLKLIDNYFWNENYHLTSNNRVYNRLNDWVEKKRHFELEHSEIGIRKRGKKSFSSPFLFYSAKDESFSLRLPAQLLPRHVEPYVHWHIKCDDSCFDVEPEVVESVTSYRVEPSFIALEPQRILQEFNIQLKTPDGNTIRSFSIPNDGARFFDEEGYRVKPSNIGAGNCTAFTHVGADIESAAIIYSDSYADMDRFYLSCEEGDVIRLPNGTASFVGRKVMSGLLSRGRVGAVSATTALFDDAQLDVYSTLPTLVLRAKKEKANGILLQINGERHKISEANAVAFSFDDGSTDVGYSISLNNFCEAKNGAYEVFADIPNGGRKQMRFVYIKGFNPVFEGAPYIFVPRGALKLPDGLRMISTSENCENHSGSEFFFEIDPNTH